MEKKLKVLSYFLPQFHRCEFNDRWWGDGFTEWNNVRAAKPLFPNHHQPRVPIEGEFDLSDLAVIERQFSLAQDSGVDAFAVYHYWYDGKMPLRKPVDLILSKKDLKVNFSLCWANHSWTRSWRNRRGALDVLIKQTYGATYERRAKHYRYLISAFSDPRYVRVAGSPLFQIYVPEDVPNLEQYCHELRSLVMSELGVNIHLSATVRRPMTNYDYLKHFDSATLAQPILGFSGDLDIFNDKNEVASSNLTDFVRIVNELPLWVRSLLYFCQDILPKKPKIYDYGEIWKKVLIQSNNAINNFPYPVNLTAFVDFDNTPRYREAAKLFCGFSPDIFEENLLELSNLARRTEFGLLFINAWNEWGEGMHLQGDERWPKERLLAVKSVLLRSPD